LFECAGCSAKCNLCKYKAMANASTMKFSDKSVKHSLMRSMEKRESVDVQKEKEEMSIVRK
jgi:flavoprotein